jgi:hypothetical protein
MSKYTREECKALIAETYDWNDAGEELMEKSEARLAELDAIIEASGFDGAELVSECPSSDNLRLIRRFEKGGSGSSGVRV